MNLEEKLYTSTEVAQILGVSLRSVYRYLEEGKLDAEVKTATGRHRFTKQNILDFLYPKGENSRPEDQGAFAGNDSHFATRNQPQTSTATSSNPFNNNRNDMPMHTATPVVPPMPKAQPVQPVQPVEEPAVEEDQVDWLAKFREAAKKFREEETKQPEIPAQPVQPTPRVVPAPAYTEAPKPRVPFNPFDSFKAEEEEVYQPKAQTASKEFYYYRSMLGGLKDIAQNIDRSARKSSVDYAFTRNAGLSLHKPIRPFSLLHAYVRPEDKEFFEKSLHLVLSDENNAQLCLITTREREVFLTKRELHNLYVVSDNQLKKDLLDAGEDDLVAEFNSVMQ